MKSKSCHAAQAHGQNGIPFQFPQRKECSCKADNTNPVHIPNYFQVISEYDHRQNGKPRAENQRYDDRPQTGQNALQQAKLFNEVADITGLVLTKLDGTAKGGIAVAIQSELGIPVKYVGVGEKIDDLQKFNSEDFVKALFAKQPE